MRIIGYRNRRDIDVEFSDGFILYHTRYPNFLNGSISSLLFPSYLGVGYIGVGKYKPKIDGIKTSAYIKWGSMLTRCYADKYIKRKNYQNCYVCEEWLNFQNFAEWHYENYYEIDGESLELDKDIVEKNNQVYCPNKCLYVPHRLNTILCNRHNDRGLYAIGVCKGKKNYYAYCNIEGKQVGLGKFDTEIEAFLAYKNAKENEIKRLSETYRNSIPDKVIDAIQKYVVEITD